MTLESTLSDQWITAQEAADILDMEPAAFGRDAGPAGSGKPIRRKNQASGYVRYELASVLGYLVERNRAARQVARSDEVEGDGPRTVTQLRDQALKWAREYYPSSGERYNISDGLKALVHVAGRKRLSKLTSIDFYDAQRIMVTWGLSRGVVNGRMRRIRRVLRWAARPPRQWIPPAIVHEAELVEPLKRGRTEAHDPDPIEPAAWEDVSATIAAADLELATAIELQWHTGMRPGEVVNMKLSELHEAEDGLLIYLPAHHKTAHHGHVRKVLIGPNGRSALDSWLNRIRYHRQAVERFRAQLRGHLPGQPGAIEDPDAVFRWGNASAYYRAIRRVNRREGLREWTPNQVRHAFGSRVRAEYGLEVAQVLMGHKHASTTEIYAERDLAAGTAAIRGIG